MNTKVVRVHDRKPGLLVVTDIDEFEEKGRTDPLFAQLDRLCKAHNKLWNPKTEQFLLTHAKSI